ncbi:MAG: hypothetical protein FWE07_07230 [Turicibacter sp.]|nr:hypothetical protein [Turicibacter sp.]
MAKIISDVIDKSRQVVDLTKIGLKIDKEEKKLEQLYANLGRVFYQVNKEVAPEVMYEDLFRTITGRTKQLEYLKLEIDTVRGLKRCVACGHGLEATNLFCSTCGKSAK